MNTSQIDEKLHKVNLESLLDAKTKTDEELHEVSGALLLEFIRNKGEGFGEMHPKLIPAAMSGYNGSTRAMSTARVADAMQFSIIKELTDDKEKLSDYVRAMLPQYLPR